MDIPITITALALLTVAMIFMSSFWSRIPPRLRWLLICGSATMIVLHILFAATKWSTTSDHLNVLLKWGATAGYELLVLLFARVSPRWLTLPCAAILLAPLISASVLLPLSQLFLPNLQPVVPMGDSLFYEVLPWANPGGGNSGVEIFVYRRSPIVPYLRHQLQVIPFNNRECNTSEAVAISLPATAQYIGRCPYWPNQASGTLDKIFSAR
jgi:hypothetical protein